MSIAYATPEQQWVKELTVLRGTNAAELLQASGFLSEITALQGTNATELSLGVFAQPVEADYLLEEGDRLEIYRPLVADPKEVRRQLALVGKTMGKSDSSGKP
ncbi:MAG: RnfH family protein [Pseudomonadota bacterium]